MSDPTIDRVMVYWPLIEEQALAHGLRPALLAGLVCQESAGNPYAMRHEPRFRWISEDYGARRPAGMSLATELNGRMTSWGLCQLMGQVARERGFRGWWPALCEPDLGLKYGAAHLAWCIERRNKSEQEGLLRYNGGALSEYPGQVLAWAGRI